MTLPEDQRGYWDRAAHSKSFGHPVNWDMVRRFLAPDSSILDYGCGYGRVCGLFRDKRYGSIVGADSSPAMIDLARSRFPGIDFRLVESSSFPFEEGTFDLVLLFAVLTSAPADADQTTIVSGALRVLRPHGVLYVSDLLLQTDKRNLRRYGRYSGKYGTYGVFELPDGGVVRHHDISWIRSLLADFEEITFVDVDVMTMNGHRAKGFQYLGRKQ
jgi:SAM-dependent methyltransferase